MSKSPPLPSLSRAASMSLSAGARALQSDRRPADLEALMEQTIKTLKELMQLDYDAVLAYTRAIDGIEPQYADIRTRLAEFRNDHERHIREISDVILALGGTPP